MTALPGGLLDRLAHEVLGSYAAHRQAGRAARVTVGGVLCRQAGRGPAVLVLTRVATDEYGSIEELPSGAVEPGETLGQALAREIREETGLALRPGGRFLFDFSYPSRRGRTLQLNFLVEAVSDDPVRLDPAEHESFRWLLLADLAGSALTPDVRDGLARTLAAAGPPGGGPPA